jgi:hypothetical protein
VRSDGVAQVDDALEDIQVVVSVLDTDSFTITFVSNTR